MRGFPQIKLVRIRKMDCLGLVVQKVDFPVPLSTHDAVYRHAITIRAGLSNAGIIYIGTGIDQLYPLKAGETLTLYAVDLAEILFKGDTLGDSLVVIAGGE
jgi:hypothetical protein